MLHRLLLLFITWAVFTGCQSATAPDSPQSAPAPAASVPAVAPAMAASGPANAVPASDPAATAAPAQPDPFAPYTTYYVGTSQASSPDGKTPYGPPKVNVAQRVVDPKNGTIIETVLDEGVVRTTILRRQGESDRFSATDDAKSFSGVVTFDGAPWRWTGWTYNITISEDVGKIVGTATIDETSIKTEKYFVGPDGNKSVQIVDILKVVTKDEYDKAMASQKKP